jgi:hypothetical protein
VIGLVRAEVLRFTSRRLFRLAAALAVGGVLAAAMLTFIRSSRDPDAGLADAREEVVSCQRARKAYLEERPAGSADEFFCPTVIEARAAYDKRFVYVETVPDVSRGVAAVLFVASVVAGASFVGAEWGSGSMTTLLTWEPRRGRVLAAKVIAVVCMLALAAALLLALLAVAFLPAGAFRGTTRGLSGSTWWTLAGIWARGAALASFGGAVAAGIATLTRNSVGVVGTAFAYGVIIDPLLGSLRGGRLRPWLLQHNVPRLLGFLEVPQPETAVQSGFIAQQPVLSVYRPIVLLTLYAAAVLAIAYAVFRSRDVT